MSRRVTDNWTEECECGRPKPRRNPCCSRCDFLDGRMPLQTKIIDALREGSALSVTELAADTEAAPRSVLRAAGSLVRIGRLRALQQDAGRGRSSRKVYALVDRQEGASA